MNESKERKEIKTGKKINVNFLAIASWMIS
jgi:hypothetical protein